MKKVFIILSGILILTSCEENSKDVEVVFVYDKPAEYSDKFPAYFSDLTLPYTSSCEIDVYLKPVSINRLDVKSKTTNIGVWNFMNSDIGEKTIEFCSNWITTYYKDSFASPLLFDSSERQPELDKWLTKTKDSILIYSEESNQESYQGRNIYSDLSQLKTQMQELICKNQINKVYILINPTLSGSQPIVETPKPVVQQSTSTNSNTIITNTKVVKTETTISRTATSSPCANQATASSIDDCISKLANASIPVDCKSNLKRAFINYFASGGRVQTINNNGDYLREFSPSSFAEHLMTTHRNAFIKNTDNSGGKISTIYVRN